MLISWALPKKTSFTSQSENTLITTHEMYEQDITAFSTKPLSSFPFSLSLPICPLAPHAGDEKENPLGLLGNCAFTMGMDVGGPKVSPTCLILC